MLLTQLDLIDPMDLEQNPLYALILIFGSIKLNLNSCSS